MRQLASLCTALGLLALVVGCAGPRTQPTTEAMETGWQHARFTDSFSERDLSAWQEISGRWSVRNEQLSIRGRGKLPYGYNLLRVGRPDIADARLSVRVCFLDEGRKGENQYAGLLFRCKDGYSYYLVQLCDVAGYQDRMELFKLVRGQRTYRLGETHLTIHPGQWMHMDVAVQGDRITALLDDEQMFSVTDQDLREGYVGLAAQGKEIRFDDFTCDVME